MSTSKEAAFSDFAAVARGLRHRKFLKAVDPAQYKALMAQHLRGARNTALLGLGGTAALSAYALGRGLKPAAEQTARAQDYMTNAQHNLTTAIPSMTVKASYEKFASEKLGAVPPARPEYFTSAQTAMAKSLSDVLANKLVADPIDALHRTINKKFYDEPEWRQNFEKTVAADPMLKDIHQQNPETLHGAFQTIKRFSPSLAKDPLATRSLLRHVAMSGGEMDFGTMKMLAETEKFHNESKRQ
jgi:hypothetical protein